MQVELSSPHPAAVRRFVHAVADFAEDPSPDNLGRYLVVSRALEESRPLPKRRRKRVGRR